MKILITYAYAGIGHKKAAEAIRNALSDFKGNEVTCIDILDWTNDVFKFLYPRFYLFLINKFPFIWGMLYYFFDLKIVDGFFAPVRRFFHNLHSRKFIEFILREKPDAVICTHFMPAEVISGLKKKNIFKGRLITVITDFLPHSFWIAKGVDYFITAIERTRNDLIRRGIKNEHIKVLGIPCDPKFGIAKTRQDMIKRIGLEQGLFNVLIMGGGFGTGPVKKIILSISFLESSVRDNLQLIVICGKNKTLFEELNNIKLEMRLKLSVFGYMDNIDEFMEASDCIVTKPGGLTISESLSKKLPMIIIQPIPGQETRNCKVLTDFGTAVQANNIEEVKDFVNDFVKCPEKLIYMKDRIKLLSYPDASRKIAEFVVHC